MRHPPHPKNKIKNKKRPYPLPSERGSLRRDGKHTRSDVTRLRDDASRCIDRSHIGADGRCLCGMNGGLKGFGDNTRSHSKRAIYFVLCL
jgi:hypothetical protein